MKNLILLFMTCVFVPQMAKAQLNLDQPILVGQSDKVFRSAIDPKVAYYIPIALRRVSDVVVTEQDDRLNARFSVSASEQDFNSALATLKKFDDKMSLRFYKPLKIEAEPKSGTDIPASFEPVLSALGDIDLAAPSPVSLNVDIQRRFLARARGYLLFEQLFDSPERDHVGTIAYEFNAVALGKPSLVRTRVSVFAGDRKMPVAFFLEGTGSGGSEKVVGPALMSDSDSKCWDSVRPGEFCFRPLQ